MYEFTTLLAQGLKILASVNIILIKSVESLCIVRKIRLRLPVSVEWRNWKLVVRRSLRFPLYIKSLWPSAHCCRRSALLPKSFRDQSFLVVLSSLTRTMSPTERLCSSFCHSDLLLRFCRYSLFHLTQLIGRVLYDVNLKSGIKWEVPDGEQNVWA